MSSITKLFLTFDELSYELTFEYKSLHACDATTTLLHEYMNYASTFLRKVSIDQ